MIVMNASESIKIDFSAYFETATRTKEEWIKLFLARHEERYYSNLRHASIILVLSQCGLYGLGTDYLLGPESSWTRGLILGISSIVALVLFYVDYYFNRKKYCANKRDYRGKLDWDHLLEQVLIRPGFILFFSTGPIVILVELFRHFDLIRYFWWIS